MTRNLNHRFEVITPILDVDHQKTIRSIIDLQLADSIKARIIDDFQTNKYVPENSLKIQSQIETHKLLS
jgi:polyphosphate kinase